MSTWGIAFILLGGGAILAAIFNWDAWFRISSAGGHMVHDAFGRKFARIVNVAAGVPLLLLGIADVTGQVPVTEFMNAWLFDDRVYFEGLAESIAGDQQQQSPSPPQQPAGDAGASGLQPYSP